MARKIGFKVFGTVQGVNFRSFTQREAQKLGLSGFVKNETSGEVVGEAIGESKAIDAFHRQLQKGPSAAKVERVELTADNEVADSSTSGGFEVR